MDCNFYWRHAFARDVDATLNELYEDIELDEWVETMEEMEAWMDMIQRKDEEIENG